MKKDNISVLFLSKLSEDVTKSKTSDIYGYNDAL